MSTIESGHRIAGRYELGEPIGQGGMGQVYRGRDVVLDRSVAIKLLAGAAVDLDAGDAADEARAAARVGHPSIARIFDSGTENGVTFVVMELVEGRPLHELMAERRTVPPREAAALAASLADALDEAHRRGVVHCDVKPRNIIVTPDGVPKLVDFGIARVTTTTRVIASDEVRGSAPYVSPEQVRGDRVDGRSDVYALGAVLYEMLAGRPPFLGDNVVAVISQRLVSDPPPLRSIDPTIPPPLEQAVLTALAREPDQRYPSAAAFRDALRATTHPPQAFPLTPKAVAVSREAPAASKAIPDSAATRVAPLTARTAVHATPSKPIGRFGRLRPATLAAALLGAALIPAIAIGPFGRAAPDEPPAAPSSPPPTPPTSEPTAKPAAPTAQPAPPTAKPVAPAAQPPPATPIVPTATPVPPTPSPVPPTPPPPAAAPAVAAPTTVPLTPTARPPATPTPAPRSQPAVAPTPTRGSQPTATPRPAAKPAAKPSENRRNADERDRKKREDGEDDQGDDD